MKMISGLFHNISIKNDSPSCCSRSEFQFSIYAYYCTSKIEFAFTLQEHTSSFFTSKPSNHQTNVLAIAVLVVLYTLMRPVTFQIKGSFNSNECQIITVLV
jgi:hypothetical protein